MRAPVAILISCAAMLATLPTPAAGAFGGRPVYVQFDCLHARVRPRSLVLACADENSYLTGVSYIDYGGARALARASWHENDCEPDCAAGRFVVSRVTVTLSGLARCAERLFYTRAVIDVVPAISFDAGAPQHCRLVRG